MSAALKHEILEKLSETMYSFKAYPDKEHFEEVAAALIKKQPCLPNLVPLRGGMGGIIASGGKWVITAQN